MDAFVSVVFIAFIVTLVGLALYAVRLRIKATRQFAAQHGLVFTGRGWVPSDGGDFELFRRGNTRRWNDVMRGAWQGRAMTYSDYQYTVSSGRSSSTYTFSIVLLELGCRITQVVVRSRSLLGRLAEQTVGAPGVHFESIDFNDRYDVHSTETNMAIEIVDARMIETLLACPRGLNVAFGPDRILVWSSRRNMEQLPALLDEAVGIAARVPDVVLHRYGPTSPRAAPATS